MMWFPLAALWGAVWWRLRGGAFTALTGLDPGTGGMRAIAAAGLVAPLLAVSWHYAALMPAWWVAWSLAGWGAFQSAGTSAPETSNPLCAALVRCGLSGTALCLAGMAIEGVYTLIVPSAVLAALQWRVDTLFLPLAGAAFALLYLIAQRFPMLNFGRFARAGSEWGEVFVGAFVGVIFWSAT